MLKGGLCAYAINTRIACADSYHALIQKVLSEGVQLFAVVVFLVDKGREDPNTL